MLTSLWLQLVLLGAGYMGIVAYSVSVWWHSADSDRGPVEEQVLAPDLHVVDEIHIVCFYHSGATRRSSRTGRLVRYFCGEGAFCCPIRPPSL